MENIEKGENIEKLIDVLKQLIDFIAPFRIFLDTLNVEYVNGNHWDNEEILPAHLWRELNKLIDGFEVENRPVNLIKHYSNFMNNPNAPQFSFYPRLKECIDLWNKYVVIDADCFLSHLFNDSEELLEYNRQIDAKFAILERQNRFMNEKKCYEVDTMSKFVANLCKKFDTNTVII